MVRLDRVSEHTFIGSAIRPGGVVVDLGMNRGDFARTMSVRYGCRVVGAEANPALAGTLPREGAIRCEPVALWSSAGRARFLVDDNSEASRLSSTGLAQKPGSQSREVEVETVTLGQFLATNRIATLDLMKVDIEGAELEVLEQAEPEVLCRASQIAVEFHAFLDPAALPRIERILARMSEIGFRWMDFTRTYRDVLLVNEVRLPLSASDRLGMVTRKYVAGVPAKLRHHAGSLLGRRRRAA